MILFHALNSCRHSISASLSAANSILPGKRSQFRGIQPSATDHPARPHVSSRPTNLSDDSAEGVDETEVKIPAFQEFAETELQSPHRRWKY